VIKTNLQLLKCHLAILVGKPCSERIFEGQLLNNTTVLTKLQNHKPLFIHICIFFFFNNLFNA